MHKLGHLISSNLDFLQLEIRWEQDSLAPKAPGCQNSQAEVLLLISLCTILSFSCLTVGLERITCLALGP